MILRTLLNLILIFLIFSCASEKPPVRIDVSEYGIHPGTKENITSAINKIISEAGDEPIEIIFPKGRYDFYPDSNYFKTYYETNTYDVNPKRLAIYLENKKSITIDAQGSDFIYHDHIQPFTLDNCEDISIKNVNIDWDYPLTAEGEILEADSEHILIRIDTSQFPYKLHDAGLTFAAEGWEANWSLSGGSFLIEYGTDHIIPAFTGDHGTIRGDFKSVKYSEAGPGLVLMQGEFTKVPKVGNYWVMRHSTRDHAGMFLFHSKKIKLENINVYHTSGLGILSQYCEDIEMQRVNTIPNPDKNRYISGHDDGLHFMGCRGEIVINKCDALGLMDDPINIHGTYVPVFERLGDNKIKCSYAHSMSMGLIWAKEGDSVGFTPKKDMITIDFGIVAKFEAVDDNSFILEFKDVIPEYISDEYSLENLSCTPNVTITNCFAGSNRARGYLISTPGKVLIENNVFETSGSAILIAGDANYWYESGPVKDLTIRGNEFRAPCNSSSYQFCNAIISIYPEIPEADSLRPYHQNITIENNTFNPADYPIIYAKSVDGLIISNNSITRSYVYEPWHFQKYNFLLEACRNVEISGNKIDEDVLGKNIMLKRMSLEELNNSNNELKVFQN